MSIFRTATTIDLSCPQALIFVLVFQWTVFIGFDQ
jgi:hypothetical protein